MARLAKKASLGDPCSVARSQFLLAHTPHHERLALCDIVRVLWEIQV
jgi:hypothetical protein